MFGLPVRLVPILLLIGSNLFMTTAWYGHLKFTDWPLWLVVFVSWGIAFFEYWLAVPANRIGSGVYSAAQLKAIQEVVTLTVFAGSSVLYLGQRITYNCAIGFARIAAGAFFVFRSGARAGDGVGDVRPPGGGRSPAGGTITANRALRSSGPSRPGPAFARPLRNSFVMPDLFRHPWFRMSRSRWSCGTMDPGTGPG